MKIELTRGELLLFVAVALYFISPVDLMLGPVDDWAVVAAAWLNRGDLAPLIDQWATSLLGGDK